MGVVEAGVRKPGTGSTAAPIRVLVVDDSHVIRGLLTRTLDSDPGIKVVASASNGKAAIEEVAKNEIDVVVLDIEMPVMDGMTALPQLIATRPGIQVIMASTLTLKGASISMKAISRGAVDYVPKPTSTGEINSAEGFKRDLISKVKNWGTAGRRRKPGSAPTAPIQPGSALKRLYATGPIKLRDMPTLFRPDCLAIGSSTGGPQALFKVFQMLGKVTNMPVFVTQHMPATFTTILAEHLAQASGMPAAEAKDGEPVTAGRIYVAPGDFHMTVAVEGGRKVMRLNKNPPENFCRPAVDPMLRSLAKAYNGKVMVMMLTGMGQDGAKGSKEIVDAGGVVAAQDEATSVVWGMPGAVTSAGLCSAVLPLSDIGPFLRKTISRMAA
ncbi:MAG TPA: chemotaxis response regulator protein-glutamate methylesterase [Alphaproteobacteria bacterium]|nr:chemotaxis response regulator protein-glutamate methylesterase [Alphaproteobacteria bacterium]